MLVVKGDKLSAKTKLQQHAVSEVPQQLNIFGNKATVGSRGDKTPTTASAGAATDTTSAAATGIAAVIILRRSVVFRAASWRGSVPF